MDDPLEPAVLLPEGTDLGILAADNGLLFKDALLQVTDLCCQFGQGLVLQDILPRILFLPSALSGRDDLTGLRIEFPDHPAF